MFGKIKSTLPLIIFFAILSICNVYAFKDSDFDGVSDTAEIEKYNTDPNKADTDGDGTIDSVEIMNETDPLDASSSPLINLKETDTGLLSTEGSTMWIISRISGIGSFLFLTAVVVFGLIQTSKILLKFKFMMPFTALEFHRTIAWTGLFLVILHVVSLLFDEAFNLKLVEALIPLQLERDLVSAQGYDLKLPVSLGIVAFYLMIMLIVTSELRNKIVSAKVWRFIHYASFAAYVFFLIHGFTSGTDSNMWWMQTIYITSIVLVFGLILGKIFRKKLFYPKPPKKE